MGCITLLSDFGMQDASAAIAKGILMQYTPELPVIDISHEISPNHMGQAAYVASAAYSAFPKGSYHLLLFDLFSEIAPKLVIAEHDGRYLLAPDNGIISLILGQTPKNAWIIKEFKKDGKYSDWVHFSAQIIASLQNRKLEDSGLTAYILKDSPSIYLPILADSQTLICDVAHIDHYGNAILNINKHKFGAFIAGRKFEIHFKQTERLSKIANNYSDVEDGEKLCRINSNNTLEIGINRGNAASLFGLKLGGRNNNIKIIKLNDSPNSTNEFPF